MIVFNLMCKDCSSEFEGWFSNSKSCDTQIKQKLVECVICNSSNIEKTLSKPNVSVNKGKDKSSEKILRELKNKINDMILKRSKAKNNKDFKTADAIRDQLIELGVEINDSSDGTQWKLKS